MHARPLLNRSAFDKRKYKSVIPFTPNRVQSGRRQTGSALLTTAEALPHWHRVRLIELTVRIAFKLD